MELNSSTQKFVLSKELELWTQYSRYIYKLCLQKCRNSEGARDFYQEIYIKYHLHAANVANHSKPGLWFKHVIDNAWNSKLREYMHSVPIVSWDCHDETIVYNSTAVDDMDESVIEPFLQFVESSEILKAVEKMLFEYLYIGFSFRELSSILGISDRALRKRFHKAVLRLEREGVIKKFVS